MSLTRRGSNVQPIRPAKPAPVFVSRQAPDSGYILALVALVSIGLIMVYSTNAVGGGRGELTKLALVAGVGTIGLFVGALMPVRLWRFVSPLFLVLCIVALISLEVPGNSLAVTVNGATRWLRLAGGFVLQPSEFTKLAFILFAAHFLERRGKRLRSEDWLFFIGVFGLLAGLIYKEPDLGTALVLAGTTFCLLIVAGVDWKKLTTGLLVGATLVFWLAWNTPHQQVRLLSWMNPWATEHRWDGGHQVIQSWAAMARGGWDGVGIGQSVQKLDNRLPESETDFIFAIVAEELGLIRTIGVLMIFVLLIWRGYTIAARAPDRYMGLVVTGITSWIAVQTGLNIGVVTGTLPNTGVPLPFISEGGSSLLALMLGCGIVIGISRMKRLPAPRPEDRAGSVPSVHPRGR